MESLDHKGLPVQVNACQQLHMQIVLTILILLSTTFLKEGVEQSEVTLLD